jgi:hypothetical protein
MDRTMHNTANGNKIYGRIDLHGGTLDITINVAPGQAGKLAVNRAIEALDALERAEALYDHSAENEYYKGFRVSSDTADTPPDDDDCEDKLTAAIVELTNTIKERFMPYVYNAGQVHVQPTPLIFGTSPR